MRKLAELLRNGTSAMVWAGETEGAVAAAPVVVEPAAPVTEPATEGAAEGGEAKPTPKAVEPAAPPDDSWKDRRIAQLTARLKSAAPKAEPVAPPAPLDPTADFERRVAAAAQGQAATLAAQQKFNDDCNAAGAEGKEKYGDDFTASVNNIAKLVDSTDERSVAAYMDFLQVAIDSGDAPRVIFELGQDMNEAQRILDLPPRKRAIEVAKRVAVPEVEADVSKAPKPITPIEPHGQRHDSIDPADPTRADNLSTAEWMKRRNAAVAAQRAGAK